MFYRSPRVELISPHTYADVSRSKPEDIPRSCVGKYSKIVGICYLPHGRRSQLCYCNRAYQGKEVKLKSNNWAHTDSDFLSLPGELRIHVYRFALSSDYEDTGARALLSLSQADVLVGKLSQLQESRRDASDTAPKASEDQCTRKSPTTPAVLLKFGGLLRTRKCIRNDVLRYIYDRLRLKLYLDSNIHKPLPIDVLKNIRTISIDFSTFSQRIHPNFDANLIPCLPQLGKILSARTDLKKIRIWCHWRPTNDCLTFKELVADYTLGVLGTMEQFPKLKAENGVEMRWTTSRFQVRSRPSECFTVKDLAVEGYIDLELVEVFEKMVKLVEDGSDAVAAWDM
jgi:hypothetical protein